jgi:hypothetical protein
MHDDHMTHSHTNFDAEPTDPATPVEYVPLLFPSSVRQRTDVGCRQESTVRGTRVLSVQHRKGWAPATTLGNAGRQLKPRVASATSLSAPAGLRHGPIFAVD